MKTFRRYLAILPILFHLGCQTQMAAKPLSSESLSSLTLDNIFDRLERGQISFENLTPAESDQLQSSLSPLAQEKKSRPKLEYFLSRLSSNQKSEVALKLLWKLQIHLALAEKDNEEAERLLLQLLAKFPDEAPAKLRLGILYLQGSKFVKAIPFLEASKEDPRAIIGLITAHRMLEENDRVEVLCDKYREELPEVWAISYNCALFESQNMDAPASAIALLNDAMTRLKADEIEGKKVLSEMIAKIESTPARPKE